MKVRSDFVTNSSSSSFVCMGIDIGWDITNFIEKFTDEQKLNLFEVNKEYLNKGNLLTTDEQKIAKINALIEEGNSWNLSELFSVNDFSIGGQERDVLGIEISTLLNKYPELKLGEVSEFVKNKLEESFGIDGAPYLHEEGWFDG